MNQITITTPGLSTKNALMGIIAGTVLAFLIYTLLSVYWASIAIVLGLYESFTAVSTEGSILLIKLLMAFTACTITITGLLPFLIKRASKNESTSAQLSYSKKQWWIIAAVMIAGLSIQYFLTSHAFLSTNHPAMFALLLPFILAMILFFVPWIPFIKNFRSQSYRWIAVSFSVSVVCSALFSVIYL